MRKSICVLAYVIAVVSVAIAGDAVEPASTAVTNARNEAIVAIPGNYYRGDSLLLTNCWCYSDGGTTTQGLNNVTVEVTLGNSITNNDYTATVYAIGGVTSYWYVASVVPTGITSTMNLQVTLTDENTNSFTYPWKIVQHRAKL